MGRETTLDRGRPINPPLKLLVAGGGTGGHVIPALVLAREFCRRAPGREVLFVGTARGVESRMIPAAGFPLELLEVGALQGQNAVARLKTLAGLPLAILQSLKILKKFRPDVVLGVGGYAAGPMMLATLLATLLPGGRRRVPLAVYEPNAYPGLVNRWVARFVARAFVNFAEAGKFFGTEKTLHTGIPVRDEFFAIPAKPHAPPFTVLVFGGSQGARSLNRAMVEALPLLDHSQSSAQTPVRLLLQTGQSEYNRVREAVERHPGLAGAGHEVSAFMDRMWDAYAQADLVICRAGATTVAELAAAGCAAVLVPFPTAANQHQLRNAEALEQLGAARLLLDRDLSGERICELITELLNDPARLASMENAIRQEAHPDATERIVNELEKLAAMPG
ncbi:MAG: undecaprenyldiphospho-muramoylpentapeptide beta-N-acetylglucosaminyltransferase [Acidobacteria bacterium]|nr:undecaprenyldiphospho-muramoylpentapeptide beta-N-acetylglucosaminyltransferase [Acidobacteriota bacterium]